ncbi:MAG: hypothetical protein LH628_03395 [Microcoleus sp. CAN_BIN18]|nr:hypothetical protein [Microcoleus sp. CAN_BIN18]
MSAGKAGGLERFIASIHLSNIPADFTLLINLHIAIGQVVLTRQQRAPRFLGLMIQFTVLLLQL